ncbi:MAG: ATP-dependent DNA helicase RecQ [Flavobacteriales bacterium]|nr:ATP-dependent DNA helicase RecQ [Flavobacteriales bacterium]
MENINKQINNCLNTFFGFKKFKGKQEHAIKSIINGNNTFVIMPTGGGKSLCYQLPAILLEGTAIIISPLIALMKNQVDSIRSYANNNNIAHFFNSSLSNSEREIVKKNVINGNTKLLFVAPETINKKQNLDFLKKCEISFFAIDEAHCISEWGHDFRPEYRRLKKTINEITNKPIIALTATATKKVKNDIIKNLGIENSKVFTSSFNRPNLYYEIREEKNVEKNIIKFIKQNPNKSGIIYCLSRKKAEEISELLNLNNLNSLPYHAGLEQKIRMQTQDAFLMEKINIVVATIAFGMGIDKPDVRYVIHYNLPKSLENYYQETGRCGRDGGEGQCILYYKKEDVEKFQNFNSKKNGNEKEISIRLLEEMVTYIENSNCRRKKILHYFGEEYDTSNCEKKCDNCKYPTQEKDFQIHLMNIITTLLKQNNLIDTNQLITRILTEKKDDANQLLELNQQILKQIIEKAITDNLIIKDVNSNSKLKITKKGELYLNQPSPFMIYQKVKKIIKKEKLTFDYKLVSILKEIRKKISIEKNVPPFIIFQDPSIHDMAMQFPTNNEEFKNIVGVGEGKIKKYGEPFILAIQEYVKLNNINRSEDYVIKSKPKKNDLKIFIIQSADRKLAFDDIIEQKNISMDILIDEIESIVNSGTKINIDYHLDYLLEDSQQDEIYDYFINEADNDSIVDAIEYFENEYEEEEMRLMKIKLFSDLAN